MEGPSTVPNELVTSEHQSLERESPRPVQLASEGLSVPLQLTSLCVSLRPGQGPAGGSSFVAGLRANPKGPLCACTSFLVKAVWVYHVLLFIYPFICEGKLFSLAGC